MTIEERKALQTVIIAEITEQQQTMPTLLIDALLSDQGRAFVHQVLSRRLGIASSLTQTLQHLARAFQQQTLPSLPPETQDEVA